MKKTVLPALVVTGAALLAACGTTVTGQPTVDASASPSTQAVPAGLDVGSFPTTPRSVPSPSLDNAWVLEGSRMGEALIQVNEIDPRLTIGGAGLRSYPVLKGSQLSSRVPDATASAFTAVDMKVGMTTTRGDDFDKPKLATRIGLYRFGTPDDAKKAFDRVKTSQQGMRAVPITSVPGVIAAEFKPGTVDSYLVEGPFVINISGTGATTDEGAKFVSKGYELELPKVKSFSPTPTGSIQSLPADNDRILARTLYQNSSSLTESLANVYYGLPTLLHKIRDISKADQYRNAGVDLVGEGAAIVYRTSSADAAKKLADWLGTPSEGTSTAASPTGLPQAKCLSRPKLNNYFCSVPVGRFTATAGTDSLAESQQKIAAQYALLAKNP